MHVAFTRFDKEWTLFNAKVKQGLTSRVAIFMFLSCICFAQNYTAEKVSNLGIETVLLTDAANGVEVSVIPSLGDRAYQMKVHGKDILYYPPGGPSDNQKNPKLGGVPFLAP
jgi:hypothetical protein